MGDNEVIFVRGPKTSKACSVLLRGANDFLLDEMDRSLHDVLCVVQRVLESKSVVAGGGAVEAALSMYLESFATTLATKEQLAIKEFAEALLAIPKTLAVNAAKDSTELVAKLCAFHHAAQQSVRAHPAPPPVSFPPSAAAFFLRLHTGAPPMLWAGFQFTGCHIAFLRRLAYQPPRAALSTARARVRTAAQQLTPPPPPPFILLCGTLTTPSP